MPHKDQHISQSRSQETKILWLLQAAWPNWTPAPELAKISLQYNARIWALRRQGWEISNRVRTVNGIRHGEFRLGSASVPASKKFHQENPETPKPLFGDLAPDRSYRE